MKILLIEDEFFIRDLYKRQLNLAGFQTETASDGKEANSLLASQKFDLILLDIMLPDTNGLEVLKFMKGETPNKDSMVIILSNLGQDVVVQEGLKLGAKSYLIKASMTPNEMVVQVKNILEGKPATLPQS